jgi:hypothetical protein
MIFKKINQYRFSLWIAVFSFLLAAIPFNIIVFNNLLLAKFFGFLLVVLLIVALRVWFSVARNRNNIVPRVILNKNDIFDLKKDFKGFSSLNPIEQDILKNRIGILLSKVKFVDGSNALLDKRNAIRVAYVYVCLNWSEVFSVESDWIFLYTSTAPDDRISYKFVLLEEYFEGFKTKLIAS